jgi:MoaA/NifB/PqqE/SkfB family radical SAM enzyme
MSVATAPSKTPPRKPVRELVVKVLSLPGRLVYRSGLGSSYMLTTVSRVLRRFMENTSPRKVLNLAVSGTQYVLKSEKMYSWPNVLKIDISPLCGLRCTICVHADANGNESLERQEFNSKQKMSVEEFTRIINEVKGKVSTVSLFYMGDPLMHPDMDEMCTIARKAKINVHVSTHFSYALSDERIKRLVKSGLTHLTVCVDGLSQEKYELTRIGGKLERVLSNLRRVCSVRKELGQVYPKVEVQFVKFQHNVDDLDAARQLCDELGVDQFTDYWGYLNNYTDLDPGSYAIHSPKKNKRLPQCLMPHFFMLIKYNGDVIPCCYYRMGDQYTGSQNAMAVGNVFETSVWDVWNSPAYRALRRVVSNPQRANSEPELKENFCHGCPAVFDTEIDKNVRQADEHKYEEVYTIGVAGKPVRRPNG